MSLKLAMVGYGTIAPHYVNAILNNRNYELVAVCDTDPAKRTSVEKTGAKYFNNIDGLLQDGKIDAIIVATPNYLHAKQTIAALRAGKHVLCEKPMATSLEDTQGMVNAATSAGKALMVSYHDRFHSRVLELQQRGLEIVGFEADNREHILDHCDLSKAWYLNKEYSGGGVVYDNGSLVIDILLQFIPDLKFKKGTLYKDSYGVEIRADLEFEQGTIHLDWNADTEVKKTTLIEKGSKIHLINLLSSEGDTSGKYLKHEYENLLAAFLQEVKSPKGYGKRGLKIQEMLEEIYAHSKIV